MAESFRAYLSCTAIDNIIESALNTTLNNSSELTPRTDLNILQYKSFHLPQSGVVGQSVESMFCTKVSVMPISIEIVRIAMGLNGWMSTSACSSRFMASYDTS